MEKDTVGLKRKPSSSDYTKVGEIHYNTRGSKFQITECYKSICKIIFLDGTNYIRENISYQNILKGIVKNHFLPCIHGVGYIGVGMHKASVNGKLTQSYRTWENMLQRCYGNKERGLNPTYRDCSVESSWYNFQVFADWFELNFNYQIMQGWHLDKDIRYYGNRVYSPETCCFVPNEINRLFHHRPLPKNIRLLDNCYDVHVYTNVNKKRQGSYRTHHEAFEVLDKINRDNIRKVILSFKDVLPLNIYLTLYNYKLPKELFLKSAFKDMIAIFKKGSASQPCESSISLKEKAFILGVMKTWLLSNDFSEESILKFITE